MSDRSGSSASSQRDSFRRLPRDQVRLDALDLYARVVERTGSAIRDQDRIDKALGSVRDDLVDVTHAESTLHGWRAQALFEAIVASLGRVQFLKLEDAGDVFFSGEPLKPPDFRIVTGDDEQMLVEVKNFYQKRPKDPYRIRHIDLDALQHYADVVGVSSLKFAIYWSRWNLWTLNSADRFQRTEQRYALLQLTDAMKANEMATLGDRTPGTEWPIGMVFYSDPAKPRRMHSDGRVEFTIAKAEYTVAGRVVTKASEQQIVYRLMLYGGWQEETSVEIVDDELVSVSFLFSPEEPPPSSQPFAMHAPLSAIYSAMFNQSTVAEDGEITELRIDIDPGALAALIPDDYEGEALRIWRFTLKPANSDS